jgi:hypothetical protein
VDELAQYLLSQFLNHHGFLAIHLLQLADESFEDP